MNINNVQFTNKQISWINCFQMSFRKSKAGCTPTSGPLILAPSKTQNATLEHIELTFQNHVTFRKGHIFCRFIFAYVTYATWNCLRLLWTSYARTALTNDTVEVYRCRYGLNLASLLSVPGTGNVEPALQTSRKPNSIINVWHELTTKARYVRNYF